MYILIKKELIIYFVQLVLVNGIINVSAIGCGENVTFLVASGNDY